MNGEKQGAPESGSWQFKPDTAPLSDVSTPAPANPVASTAPAPAAPPQFSAAPPSAPEISWTASEFIAHSKSPLWFTALAVFGIAATALMYIFTKDIFSTVVVMVIIGIFGFLAAHKPRVLGFHVGPKGVSIGDRVYDYSILKSFGLLPEGAIDTIVLTPLKRFMPSLTLYCPPEEHDKIVETLGNYLPFAPVSHDFIDQIMHTIRL